MGARTPIDGPGRKDAGCGPSGCKGREDAGRTWRSGGGNVPGLGLEGGPGVGGANEVEPDGCAAGGIPGELGRR